MVDEAFRAITGASCSSLSVGGSGDALAQNMANGLAAGNAVTAGRTSTSPTPIVSGHAYDVHSVTCENGVWYVTVCNPWGYDGASYDSNPGDGLLTLTLTQFHACFSSIEICNA
jgi:hypothetical protein